MGGKAGRWRVTHKPDVIKPVWSLSSGVSLDNLEYDGA
jgi:hypothetical protein